MLLRRAPLRPLLRAGWSPCSFYSTGAGGKGTSQPARSDAERARFLDDMSIFDAPLDGSVLTRVDSIKPDGFVINNTVVKGPVALLSNAALLFKVPSVDKLTPEHLSLLQVLKPCPDLLILGTGDKMVRPPPAFQSALSALGISIDVSKSSNACATFNVLVQEGRAVVAILFPKNSASS